MGKMSITTRGAYTVRPAVKSDRIIIECRAGGLSPAGVPGRQVHMDLSYEEAKELVKNLTATIARQYGHYHWKQAPCSTCGAGRGEPCGPPCVPGPEVPQAAFEVVGSLTYDSATDALTGASQSPAEGVTD